MYSPYDEAILHSYEVSLKVLNTLHGVHKEMLKHNFPLTYWFENGGFLLYKPQL